MNFDKVKLIFAPMAGVGDSAMRTMAKTWGADEVISEMISAKAVVYKDKKTFDLTHRTELETPFRIQLFGSEPEIIAEALGTLKDKCHPDGFDINMGCPVGKIVKNGEGSALMKRPELVYDIVKSAVGVAGNTPVSTKIRSGFDKDSINAVEVALACESGGADRIAVHGRTRAQLYSPPVNIDVIRQVKEAVKIEVIGNGDITSPEKAKEMLDMTGCDHLMIGRGALGRPWIFGEIKAFFKGEEFQVPTGQALFEQIEKHLTLAISEKGTERAIPEARAQLAYYIKGLRGSASVRARINSAKTLEEIKAILSEIF